MIQTNKHVCVCKCCNQFKQQLWGTESALRIRGHTSGDSLIDLLVGASKARDVSRRAALKVKTKVVK